MKFLPRKDLLSYEEMLRLVGLFCELGIKKVRITGGEPFVKRDLMSFFEGLSQIKSLEEIHLTTNGVLTEPYIPELKRLGIKSVNLSVDTFDRERFKKITHRDEVDRVKSTFDAFLAAGIPLKINAVVMEGQNIEDIVPLASLSIQNKVSVRFIEEMPFNGIGRPTSAHIWNHQRILQELQNAFPNLTKEPDPPNATAAHYRIGNARGTVGIIAAYSRTFCGTCNRIRITSKGNLKKCLYDEGLFSIRDLLRSNSNDEEVKIQLKQLCSSRPANGFEAERQRQTQSPVSESMSIIGG